MQYYRFPENKVFKTAFGVILLLILMMTRDTMYSMAALGFYKCQFLMLGLIAVLGLAFLWHNRKNLKNILTDRRILAVVLVSLVFLVPVVVKRDWQLMYLSILLGIYFAIFLSYFVTVKEVAKCYVLFMSVLGVWSVLCTYVLRIFLDNGIFAVPVVYNSLDIPFHNFGLAFVSDWFVKNRNFGIFREPGVHQFFLLIALYLNNYQLSWDKSWKLWAVNGILAVTMLTTFATGGVIEMGLLAVVLFFDKKWYADKRARMIAIALVVTIAAFIGFNMVVQTPIYYEVRDMVLKFVLNPESTGARFGSIAVGVEIFFQHPIFGTTVENVLHAVQDNTSSTLILYGLFGFIGGTVNVIGWVALVWKKEQKIWVNLSLLVILFMSFNTQNLTWNVFFWLFPMLALAERGLPLFDKLRRKG